MHIYIHIRVYTYNIYIYIYMYIHTYIYTGRALAGVLSAANCSEGRRLPNIWVLPLQVFCLLSRFIKGGVQRKQGVVIYMVLYIVLLYNTTPIHCTPLRLHPPLMNTHVRGLSKYGQYSGSPSPVSVQKLGGGG